MSGSKDADEPVAQLLEALETEPGGLEFDGLVIEPGEDRYRLDLPDERATGLTREELRDRLEATPGIASEWVFWTQEAPADEASRAFLRWLERADERGLQQRRRALEAGVTRTWGELQVRVELERERGRRTYSARLVEDAAHEWTALERCDDPAAVRDHVQTDDDGRYRPLATAPTLPTGWVIADVDAAALCRTVEAVYPASIANWHREREGDLDVTHWRETAERQTGIYDVVDELAGEQVDWLAAACCSDSRCLKRREWGETADDALAAPAGEGEFPCREPCSYAIAAAREIAVAAGDGADAAAGEELAEDDRAQLSAILDAVAAGRLDEIREGDFDHPAHPVRAGYLRAKLFGDVSESTENGEH